jgi:hypothetical protein
MSEKIAVFAPIPSASERIAIEVKRGLRRKVRSANFRSAKIPLMEANTTARDRSYENTRNSMPSPLLIPCGVKTDRELPPVNRIHPVKRKHYGLARKQIGDRESLLGQSSAQHG